MVKYMGKMDREIVFTMGSLISGVHYERFHCIIGERVGVTAQADVGTHAP